MPSHKMVVGVDIGSTKVTTVIAEVIDDNTPQIIGVGFCPSQGIKRGAVVNIEKAVAALGRSLEEAETMAGVKVNSVLVGIAGDHIKSINSKGVIAIQPASANERTGEISKSDVNRVIEAAKAVNLPMDREILHVLPQKYVVDEQNDIDDPVGMSGVRLEADVHIITSGVASAQNLYRCVRQADIQLKDIVLQPLASSYAVLSKDEREMGVGLIDIGGGTTDIAVFNENAIRHTSVIGIGGENVTRDIGIGLRTPFEEAERIKRDYGHCFAPLLNHDQRIGIPGIGGREAREIPIADLTEIIQMRMEEIFSESIAVLRKAGVWNMIYSGGIVLTGGASLITGARELAEQMFGLPVKVGYPAGLEGLEQSAYSPVYSTAVGLVLYGLQKHDEDEAFAKDNTNAVSRLFKKIGDWFVDIF